MSYCRTTLCRLLAFSSFVVIAAVAADRGSPTEARAMLMKAIAHYKAVGRSHALADFTGQIAPFRDRDLYVVCIDRQRMVSANGGFAGMVHVPADVLKAANGEGVGTLAWEVTEAKGEGIVRYRWVNPATRRMEWKLGFFARVGEDVCGVGIYTPE
jgi:cytochrome c